MPIGNGFPASGGGPSRGRRLNPRGFDGLDEPGSTPSTGSKEPFRAMDSAARTSCKRLQEHMIAHPAAEARR